MKVKPVPVELVAQTCRNMAKLKEPKHDSMLIDALVKLYHQKPPSHMLESYQQGLRAGIRYALMAVNVKIPGIRGEE